MNLENLVGQKIQSISPNKNDSGDVIQLTIIFDDGSNLLISPSNYNYGPQELQFDIY